MLAQDRANLIQFEVVFVSTDHYCFKVDMIYFRLSQNNIILQFRNFIFRLGLINTYSNSAFLSGSTVCWRLKQFESNGIKIDILKLLGSRDIVKHMIHSNRLCWLRGFFIIIQFGKNMVPCQRRNQDFFMFKASKTIDILHSLSSYNSYLFI